MYTEYEIWKEQLSTYSWDVNLASFKYAKEYPGFFNRVVRPTQVVQFETMLRNTINDSGNYQIAGEVCYWKNYGNHQSRDELTNTLLHHLVIRSDWLHFCSTVQTVCTHPILDAFLELQYASGQSKGFATVITYISFYNPQLFPMVDKHIANWWSTNRQHFGLNLKPTFAQRESDGWIETTSSSLVSQNWNAYMEWTYFCRDYAQHLGGWRARDVEMAVWMAQKHKQLLPPLPIKR